MTAKPQISDGAGVRVGVPLARAQRLAARAETPGRRQRLPALLLGCAFVGLVVSGLLAPGRAPAPAAPVVSLEAVADTAATTAGDFADLPQLPAPRSHVRARIFACVAEIEDRLRDLGGLAPDPDLAAARADLLAALVQTTVDCRAAKLEIAGSLELLPAGIADLRVDWDRDTSRLHLTVIDEVDPADARTDHAEDGLPVTFVVH